MGTAVVNQKGLSFASRSILLAGLAIGLLATLAVVASAQVPGTGAEAATDPVETYQPGMEVLRIGGTSTNTGSVNNEGDLNLWIKVNTFTTTPPTGLPRHPTTADLGTVPQYYVQFELNGLCISTGPSNSPPASSTWTDQDILVEPNCSPQNPVISGSVCASASGTGNCFLNVMTAEWVCNEVHLTLPRYWLYVSPPQSTPADGDAVDIMKVQSNDNGAFRDSIPLAPSSAFVGVYTLGDQGLSPNVGMVTAAYFTSPSRVNLAWSPPLGGNTVTGYRVERGPVGGPYATIATGEPGPLHVAALGASATPATSYVDTSITQAGVYEYRVTPLRCNDLSIWTTTQSKKVSINVPPVPPPLTADFIAVSPQSACGSYPVSFYDTSSGPAALATWLWTFDGVPADTTPDVVHQFTTSGQHQVRLDVTDTDTPVASKYVIKTVVSYDRIDCCPVITPLANIVVDAGSPVDFTITATDADGERLSYGVDGFLPTTSTMDNVTGHFSWSTPAQGGRFPVDITASDGTCTVSRHLILTVVPAGANQIDTDDDGVPDFSDNCPSVANHEQFDTDGDRFGDLCDQTPCGANKGNTCVEQPTYDPRVEIRAIPDTDHDGVADKYDNCKAVANNKQADDDGDNIGDICDVDTDGDLVIDAMDNCPTKPNRDQLDVDRDGKGDACNPIVGAGGIQEPGGSQGVVAKDQSKGLGPIMKNVGMGVAAFVLVGVGSILLIRRLKAK